MPSHVTPASVPALSTRALFWSADLKLSPDIVDCRFARTYVGLDSGAVICVRMLPMCPHATTYRRDGEDIRGSLLRRCYIFVRMLPMCPHATTYRRDGEDIRGQ